MENTLVAGWVFQGNKLAELSEMPLGEAWDCRVHMREHELESTWE